MSKERPMEAKRNYAERHAALETRRREIAAARDTTLATLAAKRSETMEQARAAETAAQTAFDDACAALEREIAAELRDAVYPLVRAFPDTPRATAMALAAQLRTLGARARDELGSSLDPRHLVLAFAMVHGIEAFAGRADFVEGPVLACADRALRCIEGDHLAPAVEAELRDLEVIVVRRAKMLPKMWVDAERAKVMASWATTRGVALACERFDAARRQHPPAA